MWGISYPLSPLWDVLVGLFIRYSQPPTIFIKKKKKQTNKNSNAIGRVAEDDI